MRRLYNRIYKHFLILLVVVGVGTAIVLANGWRGMLHDQADRMAQHVARVLADVARDPARLSQRALETAQTLDIDVQVRDANGHVIAEDMRKSWHVLRATATLRDAGGALAGEVTVSAPRDTRAPSLLRPILLVFLVFGAVGAASRHLARRITRPLDRITAASRAFGAGDLSTRVPVGPRWARRHHLGPHRDELHDLAHAWNDMAERIERLVKGQKELLANVSHELRSPLARIRVAMEMIPPRNEDRGYLTDVERDLGELERLIEDVLATSRLDVTGLPARRETVEVAPLLADLATRAEHDPQTRGKAVRAEAPADLRLEGDPTLLRRAVWNLVENAGKYGAPPIVMSAHADEGGTIVLAVTDQGEGIPEEERDRVLEPFYRVDKARTPAGPGQLAPGFGLGLTFAKKVAEVHGGTLSLGPATPSGWRVELRIPRG